MNGQLDIQRVQTGLAGCSTPFDFLYLTEIGSTNSYVRELPGARLHEGLVVITDFQSAGRGRLGRSWTAPPNASLLFSLVLHPMPVATDAVMLMALSVQEAIESLGGTVQLKWPNDVLVNGQKVCGILSELVTAREHRWAVIGTGINVSAHPELFGAGSLVGELGREISREDLLVSVLDGLDRRLANVAENPAAVFEEWAAHLHTIGREVTVREVAGTWTGTAVSVDRHGGLHVRLPSGEERVVHAADVSVRTLGGFTTS
jgi:BirA family biotin operon repressor/biotin-[acetyl-CoA-carboxylase] ligase